MKKKLILRIILDEPIAISDEEIQIDDMVYDTETKSIRKIVGSGATTWSEFRKIELLSEHFSNDILQLIVDGVLVDGSEIEVETRMQMQQYPATELDDIEVLVLDSNGHAVISIPDIFRPVSYTTKDLHEELDWTEVDKPFPIAQADAILGLGEEDYEPDWNNIAQQQSDADYESGAPTPYDM